MIGLDDPPTVDCVPVLFLLLLTLVVLFSILIYVRDDSDDSDVVVAVGFDGFLLSFFLDITAATEDNASRFFSHSVTTVAGVV